MSVYKEAEKILSQLDAKQRQIYNDAADYGIPITESNSYDLKLVKALVDQYYSPVEKGGKDTREEHGEQGVWENRGVTTKINLMEEGIGKEYVVTISYWQVKKTQKAHPSSLVGNFIAILSIDKQYK